MEIIMYSNFFYGFLVNVKANLFMFSMKNRVTPHEDTWGSGDTTPQSLISAPDEGEW
jgi:hypothetical protein